MTDKKPAEDVPVSNVKYCPNGHETQESTPYNKFKVRLCSECTFKSGREETWVTFKGRYYFAIDCTDTPPSETKPTIICTPSDGRIKLSNSETVQDSAIRKNLTTAEESLKDEYCKCLVTETWLNALERAKEDGFCGLCHLEIEGTHIKSTDHVADTGKEVECCECEKPEFPWGYNSRYLCCIRCTKRIKQEEILYDICERVKNLELIDLYSKKSKHDCLDKVIEGAEKTLLNIFNSPGLSGFDLFKARDYVQNAFICFLSTLKELRDDTTK